MKKLICLALSAVMLLLATACGHEHTFADATCTEPKTCTECGETEGEANGHSFAEATCEKPKTCEVCGATEGEANGHSFAEATCEKPKTCEVCGATEGEALGHLVSIGLCSRCNHIANSDDFDELLDMLESGTSYMNKASEAKDNASLYFSYNDYDGMYECYCEIAKYNRCIQSVVTDSFSILNKYDELSDIKVQAQAVVDYTVNDPANSSYDGLLDFMKNAKGFDMILISYLENLKNWLSYNV